jgi:hypothetical protein
MKLRYNEEGEDKFLEVSVWSFVKCHIVAELVIVLLYVGIVFGFYFLATILGY